MNRAFVAVALLYATLAPALAQGGLLTDSITWADAGANYESLSNPFAATSANGARVEVRQEGPQFVRLDQSDGWYGNFQPFETVLWTYYGGAITIDFGALNVNAFSVQVQPDLYGAYTAQLEAFDAMGALVAQSSGTGVSNPLGDGSAVRLGLPAAAAFRTVRISLTEAADVSSFAIGRLDFATASLAPPLVATANNTAAVPEPGTLWCGLVATAALTAILGRRRARQP